MLPVPPSPKCLNESAVLPYGVMPQNILSAMNDFVRFLTVVNRSLKEQNLPRLESICMPANFSSIVGEFVTAAIPKYCQTIAKNKYHNGHPDLVPRGVFPDDMVQHSSEGIEVKASRYHKGWQGHNAEEVFLMVFVFCSDSPKSTAMSPFQFLGVYGANLEKTDWKFSGRSATSRRTITASVTSSGYLKMTRNWIYRVPEEIGGGDLAELEL